MQMQTSKSQSEERSGLQVPVMGPAETSFCAELLPAHNEGPCFPSKAVNDNPAVLQRPMRYSIIW